MFIYRGKGDYQIDYTPAPRITEADKNNDKRYICSLLFDNLDNKYEGMA